MEKIKFYHIGDHEQIYFLEGKTVSWDDKKVDYPLNAIKQHFENKIWIKIEEKSNFKLTIW